MKRRECEQKIMTIRNLERTIQEAGSQVTLEYTEDLLTVIAYDQDHEVIKKINIRFDSPMAIVYDVLKWLKPYLLW